MQNLVSCTVTRRHVEDWARVLVTDAAPYFLPDSLLSSMPADIPLFPRHSGLDQQLTLALRDSYTIYRVDSACRHVVFLTDDALCAIPPSLREELLYAQWRYGRGQIYDKDQFTGFLPSDVHLEQLNGYSIDTEAGQKCVLGATLWRSLSFDLQESWLRRFVADQQHPYPTVTLDDTGLSAQQKLRLGALANTFAFSSGSNCFATTLAGITENAEYAHTISTLWLHQDEFLYGLARRGYAYDQTVNARNEGLNDAVIIWSDELGAPRHVCWLIGRGIVLNKNGQAWYEPRHLAAIQDVLAYWEEDKLQVQVYTRSEA